MPTVEYKDEKGKESTSGNKSELDKFMAFNTAMD